MSNWQNLEIEKIADFNPRESLSKGSLARKIPMDCLRVFEKKIVGFEFANYSGGPKFRNGDTLLAKITPCLENGKTAKVDILNDDELAFGSSEFIVLRAKENNNSDYLYYLARSPAFRKKAISCMEGTSGRKRINEGALKLQVLPIPNPDIQKKIVSVLSTLDAKIELNNQINAELEKMAKTIYDYWFVQFDFPDANGKPYKSSGGKMVWNKELKREIPDEWLVKTVGEYAEVKKGDLITEKDAKNGDIKVVAAGIGFSYFHSEYNRDENTITISGSGANAGFINFWREPIFASDCITVRGKTDADTILILHHLKFIQNHISSQTTGSAQPHVYPSDIKILNYAIPNDSLIKEFSKLVIPMNKRIANNLKENQELVKIRDWLLPMLMNGQVKVL